MDHETVGRIWNENAHAWTELARAGYDVYRDHLNTPAFLDLLPDVLGAKGLDIGCGEGHNTRMIAAGGARMTGVDISEVFLGHARASEARDPLGIEFLHASAVALPFVDGEFDFAVATMSLMDIPETGQAIMEAHRVIKPRGFFQFSIAHPCFDTPHRRNLRNADGETYAIEVGRYFDNQNGDITEWTFGQAPRELREKHGLFRVPRFTRTMSEWITLLIDVGFLVEAVREPRPSEEAMREHPSLQDASVVAYFIHFRVRKPS